MVQRWILKVFLVQTFLALNALAGSADEVRGYTPRENASSPLWCGNVQQIAGTREDKKEILCRAVPPGKGSNQGNTSDTVICIKPLPAGMPAAQANMLCGRVFLGCVFTPSSPPGHLHSSPPDLIRGSIGRGN